MCAGRYRLAISPTRCRSTVKDLGLSSRAVAVLGCLRLVYDPDLPEQSAGVANGVSVHRIGCAGLLDLSLCVGKTGRCLGRYRVGDLQNEH